MNGVIFIAIHFKMSSNSVFYWEYYGKVQHNINSSRVELRSIEECNNQAVNSMGILYWNITFSQRMLYPNAIYASNSY